MPNIKVSCSCSPRFIIVAVGAASLGVAIWSYMEQDGVNCGENGKPPLLGWIFGTGISYLIIGMTYTSDSDGHGTPSSGSHGTQSSGSGGHVTQSNVSGGHDTQFSKLSNLFIFAWTVVGGISLWRDGTDCKQVNSLVWKMGLSAVILSIIVSCCCGGFEFWYSNTDQVMGQNQVEETERNQDEEMGRSQDEEVGRAQDEEMGRNQDEEVGRNQDEATLHQKRSYFDFWRQD